MKHQGKSLLHPENSALNQVRAILAGVGVGGSFMP